MNSSRIGTAVLSTLFLLATAGCATSTEVGQPAVAERREVAAVEPTAVVPLNEPALAAEPSATAIPLVTSQPEPAATAAPTALPAPTSTPAPTPKPTSEPVAVATIDHSGLAGTRGLTLQWISWEPEDWGSIDFVPLVDGSYAVSGSQEGFNGDTVTVDGTIVRISDRELLFTGEVIVTLDFASDGQPCVRSGDITFLATGDRRFWRMQDLLNCDGIITDYVDIYFG